jgi:Divergent InlB B-repeat domain
VGTLTSLPQPGAIFTGWFGGGCAGTEPCILTGSAPLTIISRLGEIRCGDVCSGRYSPGTVVTLKARPKHRTRFAGWSYSGCGEADTCTVTMDKATSVTAVFVKVTSQ